MLSLTAVEPIRVRARAARSSFRSVVHVRAHLWRTQSVDQPPVLGCRLVASGHRYLQFRTLEWTRASPALNVPICADKAISSDLDRTVPLPWVRSVIVPAKFH